MNRRGFLGRALAATLGFMGFSAVRPEVAGPETVLTLPRADCPTVYWVPYTGSGTLKIVPASANGTIDGMASLTLLPGQGVYIHSGSENWYSVHGKHYSPMEFR